MATIGDVVRNKYQGHIKQHFDGDCVPRATALFILYMACADMEEAWRDGYADLQQRYERLQSEHASLQELAGRLQTGLDQVMIENDSWEADNDRLRRHYADSERNYEISRCLANEARAVRDMIRTHLLPHLVTPHGFISTTHLPEDHWVNRKRLLDNEGEPLDDPNVSSNLIELASEMFDELKNQIAELLGQRDGIWQAYNELKQLTTAASSRPIFVQTESPAPGASSTLNPAGHILPSPAESTAENGATAAPASSATTSPRRPGRLSTPKPPKTLEPSGEVGDTASLDPIDWRAELADILTTNQLDRLESRQLKWGRLDPQLQKMLVIRIAETILRQRGDISQSIYGEHMPDWATQVGSWIATTDLTWREVLDHLGVVPSLLRKQSRIGRYASSG